jgi:hypothetical protein
MSTFLPFDFPLKLFLLAVLRPAPAGCFRAFFLDPATPASTFAPK